VAAIAPPPAQPAAPPPAVPAAAAIPPPATALPTPPPAAAAPIAPAALPRPPGLAPHAILPPDPALLEASPHGLLPRRGADGRLPMQAYAQPFRRTEIRPRIGIVVADIGLSTALSEEAIRRLPPQIALALSPYAPQLDALAARARERGMETVISLPLEPAGYPLNDPGVRTLLTSRTPAQNADNLDWALSRFQGYIGAIGAIGTMRGERYAQMPEHIRRLHETLQERGLLYIDPRPGASPGRVWGRSVDLILDDPATRSEIERRLAELETAARLRGSALGFAGNATPVLIDRLASWAIGIEARGLMLVPVSTLAREPELPAGREPQATNIRR
jgi:polysaccharide deacetylase 2 family uncharacterized protein YibQ